MLFWMIVLLAAWIVLVALASYLAETKGYSHLGFGLLEALLGIVGFFVLNILGLFIFEICGLIIVLCLPRRTDNKIDNIDLLLKYKELLDSGIISQDEFESKKQELMNKQSAHEAVLLYGLLNAGSPSTFTSERFRSNSALLSCEDQRRSKRRGAPSGTDSEIGSLDQQRPTPRRS